MFWNDGWNGIWNGVGNGDWNNAWNGFWNGDWNESLNCNLLEWVEIELLTIPFTFLKKQISKKKAKICWKTTKYVLPNCWKWANYTVGRFYKSKFALKLIDW